MGEDTPWLDCPTCPECGRKHVVPGRVWVEDGRGDLPEGHNLYCVACGETWEGTEAEAAQAERAQQAWEAEERRQAEVTQ